MIQLFRIIAIIFVLTTMIACEGGTTYTKTIYNQSADTMFLSVYSGYTQENTFFTIYPNNSKQIYWDDQMGSFVNEYYSCTTEFDSIIVTLTSNKTLSKDIMDPGNWLLESKDGRNSEAFCTFEFDNSDLQ